MFPKIGASDIISSLALLLSIYSAKKTLDFNKRQSKFIETNDKLNELLLEKEQQQNAAQMQADVSANFVKIGRNHHRLKVFNKGKAIATNVRVEFPNGNNTVYEDDLNEKFPMPTLEPFQGVEVLAMLCNESPSRMDVKLIWDDAFAKNREKELTLAIVW
jgi:Tfp pilus assembly pilus retraction ATPase PilT